MIVLAIAVMVFLASLLRSVSAWQCVRRLDSFAGNSMARNEALADWAVRHGRAGAVGPVPLAWWARSWGISSATGRARGPVDEDQILATLIAGMENGADLRDQLEALAGRQFALPELTSAYVMEAFGSAAGPSSDRGSGAGRRARQWRVSARLVASAQLSQRLGCKVSQVLRVIEEMTVQERRVEQLRAKAFAMPRATIKLLSALPPVTVLGGELLGAHSVSFLIGSPAGWLCAAMGTGLFGLGLAWVRRLLATMSPLSSPDHELAELLPAEPVPAAVPGRLAATAWAWPAAVGDGGRS